MSSSLRWQLYVIVDGAAVKGRDLIGIASAAVRGGADVIQLRDKAASATSLRQAAERLLVVTRRAGIPLMINDRADVAAEVGADGVHLGQEDGPIAQARTILGPGRLIGRSTHSLEQALAAQTEGADYIGLGPLYPTPTKPAYRSIGTELIGRIKPQLRIPMVCIGGVNAANLGEVLAAGAECVAVVREVCATADPETAARRLKHTLTQFHRATSPSRI